MRDVNKIAIDYYSLSVEIKEKHEQKVLLFEENEHLYSDIGIIFEKVNAYRDETYLCIKNIDPLSFYDNSNKKKKGLVGKAIGLISEIKRLKRIKGKCKLSLYHLGRALSKPYPSTYKEDKQKES